MSVADLIAALQGMPQDAEVVIDHHDPEVPEYVSVVDNPHVQRISSTYRLDNDGEVSVVVIS